MEFYGLFKDLMGYIPERLSFLNEIFSYALPFILMACALFTAFFGLKYLAYWNGTTFFFLGLTLSAKYILPKADLTDVTYWEMLSVCLIIGVLCAFFSKYLFRLQLVGSTFLVIYAALPSYITFFGEIFSRVISAVAALAVAFLTVKYKYILLIVTTSFSGSFIFWGVMEERYGVPYKALFAILMGLAATAFQVFMNRKQLKETYEDVKKKYETTKKTGEKAYSEVKTKVKQHELNKHAIPVVDDEEFEKELLPEKESTSEEKTPLNE